MSAAPEERKGHFQLTDEEMEKSIIFFKTQVEDMNAMMTRQYMRYNKAYLQNALREKSLPTDGTKAVLVKRIMDHNDNCPRPKDYIV